jgi:hypothetical protein
MVVSLIEAVSTSETSVSFYKTAWHNIPEDVVARVLRISPRIHFKIVNFVVRCLNVSTFSTVTLSTISSGRVECRVVMETLVSCQGFVGDRPSCCGGVESVK